MFIIVYFIVGDSNCLLLLLEWFLLHLNTAIYYSYKWIVITLSYEYVLLMDKHIYIKTRTVLIFSQNSGTE